MITGCAPSPKQSEWKKIETRLKCIEEESSCVLRAFGRVQAEIPVTR